MKILKFQDYIHKQKDQDQRSRVKKLYFSLSMKCGVNHKQFDDDKHYVRKMFYLLSNL